MRPPRRHSDRRRRPFDALVAEIRSKNPNMTWGDAIIRAAHVNPTLAMERNRELSPPIGPGGVAMV
jgi:hypothetical protein